MQDALASHSVAASAWPPSRGEKAVSKVLVSRAGATQHSQRVLFPAFPEALVEPNPDIRSTPTSAMEKDLGARSRCRA